MNKKFKNVTKKRNKETMTEMKRKHIQACAKYVTNPVKEKAFVDEIRYLAKR